VSSEDRFDQPEKWQLSFISLDCTIDHVEERSPRITHLSLTEATGADRDAICFDDSRKIVRGKRGVHQASVDQVCRAFEVRGREERTEDATIKSSSLSSREIVDRDYYNESGASSNYPARVNYTSILAAVIHSHAIGRKSCTFK